MHLESYNFNTNEDSLFFSFQSVSDTKIVDKVIIFSPLTDDPKIYNLSLGDLLEGGEVSDLTVRKNDDMNKVVATVIQTIIRFFENTRSILCTLKAVQQEERDYIKLSLQGN